MRVAAAAALVEPSEAMAASTSRRVPPQISGDQEAERPPFHLPWEVEISKLPALEPPALIPTDGKSPLLVDRRADCAFSIARAAFTISGLAAKPLSIRRVSWGSRKQCHHSLRLCSSVPGGMSFTQVAGSSGALAPMKSGPMVQEASTRGSRVRGNRVFIVLKGIKGRIIRDARHRWGPAGNLSKPGTSRIQCR